MRTTLSTRTKEAGTKLYLRVTPPVAVVKDNPCAGAGKN